MRGRKDDSFAVRIALLGWASNDAPNHVIDIDAEPITYIISRDTRRRRMRIEPEVGRPGRERSDRQNKTLEPSLTGWF